MPVMGRTRRKDWSTDLFWSSFLQNVEVLCCQIELYTYIFLTTKLLTGVSYLLHCAYSLLPSLNFQLADMMAWGCAHTELMGRYRVSKTCVEIYYSPFINCMT